MNSKIKTAALLVIALSHLACEPDNSNWAEYHGDGARTHYSNLSQINGGNLSRLKAVWSYSSVGSDTTLTGTQMQTNAIVVNGVLYAVSATNQVFALDAATGRELWKTNFTGHSGTLSRGVTYYSDGNRSSFSGVGAGGFTH